MQLAAWEGHIGSGKSMKSISQVLRALTSSGTAGTDLNLMALGLPQNGACMAAVAGRGQSLRG